MLLTSNGDVKSFIGQMAKWDCYLFIYLFIQITKRGSKTMVHLDCWRVWLGPFSICIWFSLESLQFWTARIASNYWSSCNQIMMIYWLMYSICIWFWQESLQFWIARIASNFFLWSCSQTWDPRKKKIVPKMEWRRGYRNLIYIYKRKFMIHVR